MQLRLAGPVSSTIPAFSPDACVYCECTWDTASCVVCVSGDGESGSATVLESRVGILFRESTLVFSSFYLAMESAHHPHLWHIERDICCGDYTVTYLSKTGIDILRSMLHIEIDIHVSNFVFYHIHISKTEQVSMVRECPWVIHMDRCSCIQVQRK